MLGAACLAAEAALRAGAGLVTLALPESLLVPASAKLTEVILVGLPETLRGTLGSLALAFLRPLVAKADVLAVGPGLSAEPETAQVVRTLYAEADRPMVVDADGLNALSADAARRHAAARILTPHPGEMARLTGLSAAGVQRRRRATALAFATRTRTVVILKGRGSIVTDGRRAVVNRTGNAGLATAGSGDVLAGIVAGLWGQGMSAFAAARLAAHLHGAAGDLAASRLGMHAVLARDILAALPEAFLAHAAGGGRAGG